jgi:ribonuclease HI
MENIIFTDGASRGNPGRGGWGVVVIDSTKSNVVELGGREDDTTNNRMELTSAVEALKITNADSNNIIYTDSSYLINGITKWVFGWQRNGWKTKTKEDVLNKDLWMKLIDETKKRKVNFKHVGGHVGIAGNERCDVIATSLADGLKIDLYKGPLSGYSIKDIHNVSHDLEKIEDKKSSKARSNAKVYSYISLVDGVVVTHHSWAECEKRVKGAKGARFKKTFSKEEEDKIRAEFSGVAKS